MVLFLTRKSEILVVLIIVCIVCVEVNLGLIMNNEVVATRTLNKNTNISTKDMNIDRKALQTRFHEIRNIPYNEKTMNCKHKSELFAKYLVDMGATDVYIIVIQHESGKYSHEFVEWDEHYYDPCYSDLSYQIPKKDFINNLHKLGFNGITVQSPYKP